MPNFKSQGLKIKEIYIVVLSIPSVYFYSYIYWSRWLGGFLPLTAAKFRLVWKISDQSNKTASQIYATYFLILNEVLCIRGMWVGYFSIHKLLTLHAIIAMGVSGGLRNTLCWLQFKYIRVMQSNKKIKGGGAHGRGLKRSWIRLWTCHYPSHIEKGEPRALEGEDLDFFFLHTSTFFLRLK